MADRSKIEWTDASWTPIRARWFEPAGNDGSKERIGWHCEHVSPGCKHCYAESINLRLGTGLEFKPGNLYREERRGYNNGEAKPFLDEKMLAAPLRWRKPRKVFVCSMTDLFADFVPDDWIDRMFAVMALSPQHTFQVLTKRAERMRAYASSMQKKGRWLAMEDIALRWGYEPRGQHNDGFDWLAHHQFLPNVWLGVSAEDQQRADERIPDLLATPAAVRFVSAEPLLGPINLRAVRWGHATALTGLDWIIVGGESGPKARPCEMEWISRIIRQCRSHDVACFVKQLGARPMWTNADYGAPAIPAKLKAKKGGDPSEWPADLRVREYPERRAS